MPQAFTDSFYMPVCVRAQYSADAGRNYSLLAFAVNLVSVHPLSRYWLMTIFHFFFF
jgi:hypothetical protein